MVWWTGSQTGGWEVGNVSGANLMTLKKKCLCTVMLHHSTPLRCKLVPFSPCYKLPAKLVLVNNSWFEISFPLKNWENRDCLCSCGPQYPRRKLLQSAVKSSGPIKWKRQFARPSTFCYVLDCWCLNLRPDPLWIFLGSGQWRWKQ